MTAAHFVYIPCAVICGIVIGWILGGRAAKDHYEAEKRMAERKAARQKERAEGEKSGE